MDDSKRNRDVLAIAARRIGFNKFYDKAVLADELARQCSAVPRAKVKRFVKLAAKGKPWFGFSPKEASLLARALAKLGVSNFGYPVESLIKTEEQLVTATLSALHYGKYYYEGGASGVVSDLQGIYHLYLETTHNRVDRQSGGNVTLEGRLLILTAGGQSRQGSQQHSTKTNDNYVVEILQDDQSGKLLARAGTLINAHPEFIAVLSPYDFYDNLIFAEWYWAEWKDLIDNAKPSIFGQVAAAEAQRGLEILRFAATADGIAGSFQESSKTVGTFYGSKVVKGVNDQVLYTGNDLGVIMPSDPALIQRIGRNLDERSQEASDHASRRSYGEGPTGIHDDQEASTVRERQYAGEASKPPRASLAATSDVAAGKSRNWLLMKRTWFGLAMILAIAIGFTGNTVEQERLAELRQTDPAAYLAAIAERPEYWEELKALDPARYEAEVEALITGIMDEARQSVLAFVVDLYSDGIENMREGLRRGTVGDPRGTASYISEWEMALHYAQVLIPRGDYDGLIEALLVVHVAGACEGERGYRKLDVERGRSAYEEITEEYARLSESYGVRSLDTWVTAGAVGYARNLVKRGDESSVCPRFLPFVQQSSFYSKITAEE